MKELWATVRWQFNQKPITAFVGVAWFVMGCAFVASSTTNMLLCFVLSTLFLNRLPERRNGEP